MAFNKNKAKAMGAIFFVSTALMLVFQNFTTSENFPSRIYPAPIIYVNQSLFPYMSGTPIAKTIFYVDCSKTMNGNGLSETTAFNNVNAINALTNINTDTSILFKRGTTCYGSLKIKPMAALTLVIGDYGNALAPVPVISGLQSLSDITSVTLTPGIVNEITLPSGLVIKDLFYKKIPASISTLNDRCRGLAQVNTIKDAAAQFAISPNTLKFQGPNSPGSLSGEPIAFVRNTRWTWAKKTIDLTQTNKDILGFVKGFAYAPDENSGIEFANAPELVDCPGEWALDSTNAKLWVMPAPDTASLNDFTVSTLKTGLEVDLSKVSKHTVNLIVHDINLDGFYGDAIRASYLKNVHFKKVGVLRSGNTGINVYNSLSFYLGESRIAATAGTGLAALLVDKTFGSSHLWIEKNQVENNGRFALSLIGNGPNEEVRLDAMALASLHTLVANGNQLKTIGGNAFSIGTQNSKETSTSSQVIDNKINSYCRLINDCGAIYFNGYQQRGFVRDAYGKEIGMRSSPYPLSILIYHNEISNGIGETNYTPYKKHAQAAAIYLDWAASNASIAYNRIYKAHHFLGSVAFHGGSNIIIQSNQIYQDRLPAVGFRALWNPGRLCVPMSGNVISKNDIATGTGFPHTARRVNNYPDCAESFEDHYQMAGGEQINNFFSLDSNNQLTFSAPRELNYSLQDQWYNMLLPAF